MTVDERPDSLGSFKAFAIAEGILLIVLGLLALVFPVLASVWTVAVVGVLFLIGGIVGGGIGYVASRDDGRSWAVPLGALLGSQMGCNTGAGRGPLPW